MRRLGLITALLIGLSFTLRAAGEPQAPDGFPAAGEAPILTVVSTGAEPRQILRYKPAPGTVAKSEALMTITPTISMAGMNVPGGPPVSAKMAIELGVDTVAPNGDLTVRFTVTPSMERVAGSGPAMPGMDVGPVTIAATGLMSPRGEWREMKLTGGLAAVPLAAQAMQQAQDAIRQMNNALADAPLGIGAKWELRSHASAQGIDALQTATTEVVAINGRTVTFKISTAMTAPPQIMRNAMLPPGAEMRLVKMTGTGSGTMVTDLDRITSEGTTDVKMVMDATMNMQGTSQPLSMVPDMKMTFKPVD